MCKYSIPCYLSDELERVQRGAVRIIFPGHSYDGALPWQIVED